MLVDNWWLLAAGGLLSGLLAGLLGIGGGTVLVPMLITLGYQPIEAVATSSLAIVMTSVSGSLQNRRMGYLSLPKVLYLGIPAIITAQIGAELADNLPPRILLMAFGILLIANIFLANLRKNLAAKPSSQERKTNPFWSRLGTGGAAGFLAGLFGVGGGVIMVPLQMLLLGEPIKTAIQNSLGAIVITAISATIGHAIRGNVLFSAGIILGLGGVLGAQISTRYLPKLPDKVVRLSFYTLLALLAVYTFWQAWRSS